MSSTLLRAFAILEMLTGKPHGVRLGDIAEQTGMPKSAVHRTLTHLCDVGAVRQDAETGHYILGLAMVARAVRHLASLPLVEVAAPILDQLAAESGELVRLSLSEGDTLSYVAKRQGARFGLRYDPVTGRPAKLVRTSSGLCWLAGIERERAVAVIEAQGFDDLHEYGPAGPSTLEEALTTIEQTAELGYAFTDSTFEQGMSAIAVAIKEPGKPAVGAISIGGPTVRFGRREALAMLPVLDAAVEDLAVLSSSASPVPLSKNTV